MVVTWPAWQLWVSSRTMNGTGGGFVKQGDEPLTKK